MSEKKCGHSQCRLRIEETRITILDELKGYTMIQNLDPQYQDAISEAVYIASEKVVTHIATQAAEAGRKEERGEAVEYIKKTIYLIANANSMEGVHNFLRIPQHTSSGQRYQGLVSGLVDLLRFISPKT